MITSDNLVKFYYALAGGGAVGTIQYIAGVFIGAMEAPTKDSSPKYRYWFRVLNKFAANWARAKNTSVESSPNFQDAVQLQQNQQGPKVV